MGCGGRAPAARGDATLSPRGGSKSDGTYLGRIRTPLEFSTSPVPVFDGDRIWAVTRDELGVQRVVRYRVERSGG